MVAGESFGPEAALGAAFILGGCLVSGLELDFFGGDKKGGEEVVMETLMEGDENDLGGGGEGAFE